MTTQQRAIIAVVSDTHGGFTLGLCNPEVVLYDEGETGEIIPYKPKLSSSQVFLWRHYQDSIAKIMTLAGDDELFLIHNGDLTHGNKHASTLVSNRIGDQILIGQANMEPWYAAPTLKTVRMIVGTEAHNFGKGSSELLATKYLHDVHPNVDTSAAYHSLLSIKGVLIDAAHHGPYPGSREWLRGNVARFYLRDMVMKALMRGKEPARIVLRAHYHSYVRETLYAGGKEYSLIVTPSYSMLGDYSHQAARSPEEVTVGMVALEIIDGELVKVHELMETLDIRTKEVL